MKFLFGTSCYAYSRRLDYQSNHYLPMVAFVDDDHNLAKESGMSRPCNCKDSAKPCVSNVRNASGNFTTIDIRDAKTVKATRTALKKAIRTTMPNRADCFLAIQNSIEPGTSTSVAYFAWIVIDKDTARLNDGSEFDLSYYSSPFTCTPSKVRTKVFYDMESAITHLLSFIPQIECSIKQNEIKKAEDDSRVEEAKKKLRF
jgi:hypothetical protein